MQKSKKFLSVLLSMIMVLCTIVPIASAAGEYTTEGIAKDGFTRMILSDRAFAKDTARTFEVEISQSGDYAIFVKKTDANHVVYKATISKDGETKTLLDGSYNQSVFKCQYSRMGGYGTDNSVQLTPGIWTLSITSDRDINVEYIDIRKTNVTLDENKRAIYPSDYSSAYIYGLTHGNREMNNGNIPMVTGYTYFGDYNHSDLSDKWAYSRSIYLEAGHGTSATYKIQAPKAGSYKIKVGGRFYGQTASETEAKGTVYLNSVVAFNPTSTYAAGEGEVKTFSTEKIVTLKEGENVLTINSPSTTFGMYIDVITIEAYASEEPYTLQGIANDGFSRLVLTDKAFAANTARTFDVEIKQAGDYTVFLKKSETASTNFTVTFKKDNETKTLWNNTSASNVFAYSYVRIGGGGNDKSVSLTPGKWTMSVSAVTPITVSYIDIRKTTTSVNGKKQGIYPSDYNEAYIKAANHVNGEINKTERSKQMGYTYSGDYQNSSLSDKWAYSRSIHLDNGAWAKYKLNADKAGEYVIKLTGRFRNLSAVTSGTVAKGTVSLNGTGVIFPTLTYAEDKTTGQKTEWTAEGKVTLSAGENILAIYPPSTEYGTYVDSITVEAYTQNPENTVVLAKDLVVSYMEEAREAYDSSEYDDYQTSIASKYSFDKTKGYDKPNPVSLSWEEMAGAESYTLLISKTEDFSDVVFKAENITGTKYDVYNLCVDTEYFWKVKGAEKESAVKKFYTDDTVRYINVDGARNVRDIGGWNGLNQGWAFRGSELDYVEDHKDDGLNLTDAGRKVLHDDLGIKTDLDFRVTALTESPIGSDVKFINDYRIGGYMAAYTSDLFPGVLRTFADIDNYPIYFHCWGGADRTGTVAFLLEALCGASETELAMDYELTTFSVFGHRTRVDNPWYQYASMVAKLKEYEGATLKEKAENYAMTTHGLERSEVSNIQSILSGNAVVFEKVASAAVGRKTRLPLKNLGKHTVSSVTVNGKNVDYEMKESTLFVRATEVGEGVITFEDGNVLKFAAEENTACSVLSLGEGFTRLTMTDSEFLAGETYKFPITVKDGEYAVFLNKTATENNNFKVSFTQGDKEVVISEGGNTSEAYGYNYVRAGSSEAEKAVSALLTDGEWILNITPTADTGISFVDVRLTKAEISGAPQAIYPSDFNSYPENVGNNANVNGNIGVVSEKVLGYNYSGDYENKALAVPYAGDREIYVGADKSVSYKLNVKQSGAYVISFEADGEMTVSLDGNEATQSGENTKKVNVNLAEGEQTVTFKALSNGAKLKHLTIEKSAAYSDKVVAVDENLTRIETDSSNKSINAGSSRSFDFTVPTDGKYSFYAYIGADVMNMRVTVKNLTTGTLTKIYDGTLSRVNPVAFRKLGMGGAAPVKLSANTPYRLYIEPSINITVPFIDVMNVNIAVSGKTVFAPQYFSSTNIGDGQINCNDQNNRVTPEAGYTLAGNFLGENLTEFAGYKSGYAITPHIGNGYSLTYTLNVKKAGYYEIGADMGAYSSNNQFTESDVVEFTADDTIKSVAYSGDGGVLRLTGPKVYLTKGTHTVKISNPSGGNAGFYVHQILLTPQKGAGAVIEDKTATVSAFFGENLTGDAFVAVYDENDKLIGISKKAVSNEDYVESDVAISGTAAYSRVFVWDSNLKPLIESLSVSLGE